MSVTHGAPEKEPRPPHEEHSWRIIGMDCARDAAEIEREVRALEGVQQAEVSIATHRLVATIAAEQTTADVRRVVEHLGYRLEEEGSGGAAINHRSEAYVRALLVVALLNLGFGVVEGVAGFLADSQALKADALDFVGDGLITLVAVAATRWTARWRARTALAQGIFLGMLGAGVLAQTLYRVVSRTQPEAEIMGIVGALALLVNLIAAALLARHRTGDANVRAVWLFSRNDAIGNAAVVLAAFLVQWSGSAWPDLVVAGAVAMLFLHSAHIIVRDALAELRGGRSARS